MKIYKVDSYKRIGEIYIITSLEASKERNEKIETHKFIIKNSNEFDILEDISRNYQNLGDFKEQMKWFIKDYIGGFKSNNHNEFSKDPQFKEVDNDSFISILRNYRELVKELLNKTKNKEILDLLKLIKISAHVARPN